MRRPRRGGSRRQSHSQAPATRRYVRLEVQPVPRSWARVLSGRGCYIRDSTNRRTSLGRRARTTFSSDPSGNFAMARCLFSPSRAISCSCSSVVARSDRPGQRTADWRKVIVLRGVHISSGAWQTAGSDAGTHIVTRRRVLDDEQAEIVVDRYRAGETIDELAASLGVSAAPIRERLIAAGVV